MNYRLLFAIVSTAFVEQAVITIVRVATTYRAVELDLSVVWLGVITAVYAVLPIMIGTTIDFPNYDPIFHNAFSNYNGQIFDIGLYPPGTTKSIVFRREGVVRVFCNIHPTMSAVIVVLKSPYFCVSNKNGELQMTGVPAGSFRVHVFHERATEQTLAALTRTVEISEERAQLPPISVSESGYLQVPHTNKYGKDYAPDSDAIGYPGTKP